MDFAPLAPRPEYLPRPLPIPWPIRCRFCFCPFGGRRLLRFISLYLNAPRQGDLGTRLSSFLLLTYSLTISSRWGTFATIPRKEGVSGRSTTRFIFCRPRDRTIFLCF